MLAAQSPDFCRNKKALVVQRIERELAELAIEVRFLTRAH
jgi:hypothetical protein